MWKTAERKIVLSGAMKCWRLEGVFIKPVARPLANVEFS
jgi:hypothetical protein